MNKFFSGLSVVAVVLAVLALFFPMHSGSLNAANVTPSNALDNQALTNELNLIANPLVSVYTSSSVNYFTAAVGPIGSTTSTASTTLSFTNASGTGPFTLGDAILLGEGTTTPGLLLTPIVINSSTLQIVASNQTASSIASSTTNTTLYVTDLPRASFVAPTGL